MSLPGHWLTLRYEPQIMPERPKPDSAYLVYFTKHRQTGARRSVCSALYVAGHGARRSPESGEAHAALLRPHHRARAFDLVAGRDLRERAATGVHFVPLYNDPRLIAGPGTCSKELI